MDLCDSHAVSDDVVDLGEGDDADGGFAKQAELMKQQLHNQNQKQRTQVDGTVWYVLSA